MQVHTQGREQLLSAGIDIGTSTTKLIISRFTLANTAGMTHVPRIEIIAKEVIYKSPMYKTPLHSNTLIDLPAVLSIVQQEYQKAGILPQEIQTGAIIITGETATKQNAEEMVHLLSKQAGDFLVATAGPDLEGIIAAKGSGAYHYSKESGKTVANIDIGGGTANIAVYQAGVLKGTCTLHIGGRLIEFDGKGDDRRLKNMALSIEPLALKLGCSLSIGERIEKTQVMPLIRYMTEAIERVLTGSMEPFDHMLLLGQEPNWQNTVDVIMFSGGVGQCIQQANENEGKLVGTSFHDIGMWLAEALKAHEGLKRWQWVSPLETVRATVLGAGMQTTEISGATIQVEADLLPLRNLPIYSIRLDCGIDHAQQLLMEAVEQAISLFDTAREGNNFSLYLSDLPVLRFREIQQLSAWLAEAFAQQPNQEEPLVLLMDLDLAQVIGQTLRGIQPQRPVICIDQIKVENGDYLDIGKKLHSDVVPVVVKTLAFHT
ncbi:ethanolamine ammonia-lyase reactivating factor EutA [Caldalkalibacillus mannanilyticus]|uniref:ethanolamine ammonia-lyase reactivating factor EutA n=1 Tax=Caldalkalibacillus mannanilyticus TaxID=1418 RepID=UPI00046AF104|nr:ethanolamine ammonia-lyase reactivating factor EutA [Caldalkalibacillus mannanilyticus]